MRLGPFFGMSTYGGWWFRVWGLGLSCTDHRVTPPLFSERNGYLRRLHVSPWCLRVLWPSEVC